MEASEIGRWPHAEDTMLEGMVRRVRTLFFWAMLIAVMILIARIADPPAPPITGNARVIDGDSLVVAGTEIRLYGIDAPEYRQTCTRAGVAWACGREAASALRTMVTGRDLACRARDLDRYDRTVATCRAGELDVGGAMVKGGMAIAYGAYDAEEREAKAARRGLWSSTFDRPAEWRARHPRTSSGTSRARP
jgi:endonuclease YncB( thermonuclease family)